MNKLVVAKRFIFIRVGVKMEYQFIALNRTDLFETSNNSSLVVQNNGTETATLEQCSLQLVAVQNELKASTEKNGKYEAEIENVKGKLKERENDVEVKTAELRAFEIQLMKREREFLKNLQEERERHGAESSRLQDQLSRDRDRYLEQLKQKESQFNSLKKVLEDIKESHQSASGARESTFEALLRKRKERLERIGATSYSSGERLMAMVNTLNEEKVSKYQSDFAPQSVPGYNRTITLVDSINLLN